MMLILTEDALKAVRKEVVDKNKSVELNGGIVLALCDEIIAFRACGYNLSEVAELAKARDEGRVVVLPDGEDFVRCEDCIHGGWTDDVTTHCNKWVLREGDHRCVGYLLFCGDGEKGKQTEMDEAEAALAEREPTP